MARMRKQSKEKTTRQAPQVSLKQRAKIKFSRNINELGLFNNNSAKKNPKSIEHDHDHH